ncbi:hypothetical protein [Flavobacterium limi]|uniref:Uncharacterized protein n=1 Tax=Flavobacterium limi TaxID=2045105 RepID=A0ABQ1TZ37_9FLAO|nr:hypothetical protein [Flavobacterium limi]GGF07396.1 hypothetical protein GCM10011518_15800 [Flavobacterium limi]
MGDLTKGTIVRGLKNANLKPFSSEEVDQHGRLLDASVNGIEGSDNIAEIIQGMPLAMRAFGTRTSIATKIIQKGGRVLKAPIPGNPNHCLLSGLLLKDANNLFS